MSPTLRTYLSQAAVIAAVATALGLLHLGLRSELDWIAEPPAADAASCAPDTLPEIHLVDRISVQEVQAKLGQSGVTIVDARSVAAYGAGHIPGAMNLPADQAEVILGVQSVPIPPDDLVITYCDGGRCEMSESLGLMLKDRAGCERVRVLDGGWAEWLRQAGPVEGRP